MEKDTFPNSASVLQTLIVATDIRLSVLVVTHVIALVTNQLVLVTRHSRIGFLKNATANVLNNHQIAQSLNLTSIQTFVTADAM